jgi:metal-responsive CopG/Arc/MetJ family transcriptional regulator
MRISITLSREVPADIDRIAGSRQSRSALIEAILLQYLRDRARAQRDTRDIEIINRHAEKLNREAEDVLEYQAKEDW